MAPDERHHYSVSQAAARLGVSRVSIWRWDRDGHLPAVRLGPRTTRIRREDTTTRWIDLPGLVADTVEEMRARANQHELALEMPDQLEVWIDPERITHVLAALGVATRGWSCCASASTRSSPAPKPRTTPTRCAPTRC